MTDTDQIAAMLERLPMAYRRAVACWGQPVGIEAARRQWAKLVTLAEEGTITLIGRDERGTEGEWAALVPVRELTQPLDGLPMWTAREARAKLGALVSAAIGSWLTGREPVVQVLTRRRVPVAALVAVSHIGWQADVLGERLDPDTILHNGGTITIAYHAGEPGTINEDGDVVDPPEPDAVVATAVDPSGDHLGTGSGTTATAALLALHNPRAETSLPAELHGVPLYDQKPPF